MSIYLVRHGEAKPYGSDEPKYPGPGLTKKGKLQAKKVALFLNNIKFKKCYCSDMTRAMETAEAFKLKFTYHRELAEFNKIVFVKNSEDKEKYLTNLRRAKRTRTFFRRLLSRKGNILVVAHGNAISSMIQEFLGVPVKNMKMFYLKNCSVTVISDKIKIINNPSLEEDIVL